MIHEHRYSYTYLSSADTSLFLFKLLWVFNAALVAQEAVMLNYFAHNWNVGIRWLTAGTCNFRGLRDCACVRVCVHDDSSKIKNCSSMKSNEQYEKAPWPLCVCVYHRVLACGGEDRIPKGASGISAHSRQLMVPGSWPVVRQKGLQRIIMSLWKYCTWAMWMSIATVHTTVPKWVCVVLYSISHISSFLVFFKRLFTMYVAWNDLILK